MTATWYRYEDVAYASCVNEFEESVGQSEIKVHLREYKVVKYTPKGVWIAMSIGDFTGLERKFVKRDARKRFACPTIEEAKESFIRRKKRQISIYQARITQAEQALRIIEGNEDLDYFLTHSF